MPLPDKGTGFKRDYPIRRMSDGEYQNLREKGLCFKCDENFTVGHRCKTRETRELHVVLVNEEEEAIVDHEEEILKDETEAKQLEVVDRVELALRSIMGFSAPGMMKVKGSAGKKEVIILIDCGATHNFLSLGLVKEL